MRNLTVIESIVLAFCVIMVGAIVGPRIMPEGDQASESAVRTNMKVVQVAAESYALDHGGAFPAVIDSEFQSYFPDGKPGASAVAGKAPVNPFTRKEEWPVMSAIGDVEAVRNLPPVWVGRAGQINYCPIVVGNKVTGYAITGAGEDGRSLEGSSASLSFVLANQ